MARAAPLVGNDIRFALLGGSIVDANALLRAYVWHCIGIPVVAIVFMSVHFWRVRKDGGISGPAPVILESEITPARKPK
jgi:quinol-cytochrome oxidoreductase complex cytochrome b subunit